MNAAPIRLFVVGRSETGNVGALSPAVSPTTYVVKLQSRERASFDPLSLVVSKEVFDDLAIGNEVDVTLRPVRS